MTTIILTIISFGIVMFFLSIGLIFSKTTRLKKSCSGGLGPHRIDEQGDHVTCGTCHCGTSLTSDEEK
ncbi:MAG: hypothetical protein GY854_08220 [Deltaproteobacteria bacterium]|nr:hypothetical protein [Deltaproteobacteria bacterium]